MRRSYEAVFIFNVAEQQFSSALEAVRGAFGKSSIVIDNEKDMGQREFAYPIQKNALGRYWLFEFHMSDDQPSQIASDLRNIDGLLRYLIVKRDPEKAKSAKGNKRTGGHPRKKSLSDSDLTLARSSGASRDSAPDPEKREETT